MFTVSVSVFSLSHYLYRSTFLLENPPKTNENIGMIKTKILIVSQDELLSQNDEIHGALVAFRVKGKLLHGNFCLQVLESATAYILKSCKSLLWL